MDSDVKAKQTTYWVKTLLVYIKAFFFLKDIKGLERLYPLRQTLHSESIIIQDLNDN